MTVLILGLAIFLGIHLVKSFAPGLRAGVIAQGGTGLWHAIHGGCAILGVALIAYGFNAARPSPDLYVPPAALRHLSLTLMLLSFICLAAAFLPAGRIKAIAKHPAILAIKIWALAHLLANGELNSVVLFTAFLAWGVILRISMKRRARAGNVRLPVFVSYRYDLFAAVLGAAVYGLFVWKLHELLIGVPPMALPF